ncbi:MAG: NUDIX domain-containing protein [Saprospiraceae bacterium]|nr:NUDIX domain-containing protein [Saprospiraceae bacterium]
MDTLFNSTDYLPHLSVDCVIFGFHGHKLKVVLPKLKKIPLCSLPGGYVRTQESVHEAAQRILRERTGLENIYLEQFSVFGESDRADPQVLRDFLASNNISIPADSWLMQRFISIGYYALVDFSQVTTAVGVFDESCEWYDLEQLPDLVFDHADIIQKALETLRLMLDHKLVVFKLLPETFTMKELQTLHETILGQELRRDNFQRKMLSTGILQRVEKKFTGAANKAPYLYRFGAGL